MALATALRRELRTEQWVSGLAAETWEVAGEGQTRGTPLSPKRPNRNWHHP